MVHPEQMAKLETLVLQETLDCKEKKDVLVFQALTVVLENAGVPDRLADDVQQDTSLWSTAKPIARLTVRLALVDCGRVTVCCTSRAANEATDKISVPPDHARDASTACLSCTATLPETASTPIGTTSLIGCRHRPQFLSCPSTSIQSRNTSVGARYVKLRREQSPFTVRPS